MSVPGPPVIYPQGAGEYGTLEFWWQAPVSDGGSPILYYTLSCPTLSYSLQLSTTSFSTIVPVPNSVNYIFNITATNSIGTSVPAYFNELSAGYPCEGISSISVTIVSSFFAQVDWTFVPIPNQQVLHSYLLYATPSTVGISTLVFPVHSWISSFNVYGYTSSYSFSIMPVGSGSAFPTHIISTPVISMGKPPDPITGLVIVSQTESTLGISWSGANNAISYIFTFIPDDGSAPFTKTPDTFIGTSATFSGCNTWQNYNNGPLYSLIVTAFSNYAGIDSSPLSIRFGPSPASSLTYSSVTTSSFTLLWQGANNASSFKFSLDSGSTFVYNSWTPNGSNTAGSSVFSGLGIGSTFSGVVVYAMNGASTISVPSKAPYSTLSLLPGAVTGLAVSLISQSSFTLNWSGAPGASTIVYSGSAQPTTTNGIVGPAVFTGLTAGAYYSTIVIPINRSGSAGIATSTLLKLAPAAVTGIVQSSGTYSTLNIRWSGALGAEYYRYIIDGVLLASAISSSVSSVTISSLTANTTYSTAIVAYGTTWNSAITSTVSNYVNLTSGPSFPNLAFGSISISSFVLTWIQIDGMTYALSGALSQSSITSPLTVSSITSNSTFTYTLTGTNIYGATPSTFAVSTPPSQPVSFVYSGITATSFTVNWSGGNGATSYMYSLNGTPTTPSTDNGVASKTASFTGLSGGTTYTIVVTAVNSFGSISSASNSVTTGPGAPTGLSSNATTISSFAIYWSGAAGASSLTFHYGPSTITTPASQTSPYTISSLTSTTSYTVYIVATNSIANTSSNSINVITASPPPGQPVSLVYSSITATSFSVNWSGGSGATSYTYTVNGTPTIPSTDNGVALKRAAFTGLSGGTSYTVIVTAVNSSGSNSSASSSVTTAPSSPVSLTFSGIGSTVFTISWSGGNGATSYTYTLNGTPTTPSIDNGVASKTASFIGLSAGATYIVIVTAVNSSGSTSSSNSSVTMAPLQPYSLIFSGVTGTSFTISWSGGNGATSYTYTLNGISTIPSADNGVASKSATFSGLSLNTKYSVIITAININGSKSSALASSVTGIQLWLDANDPLLTGSTGSDGTTITTWYDKSPYSYNVLATGTPKVASNSQNSLAGIAYLGNTSASIYYTGSIPPRTFSTATTLFAVYKNTANTGSALVTRSTGINSSGIPYNLGNPDIYGPTIVVANTASIYNFNGYVTTSVYTTTTTLVCISLDQVANSVSKWTNGNVTSVSYQGYGTLTPGTADANFDKVFIGTRGDLNTYFQGVFYEIIMYNTPISTSDRQRVEGYLAWKWGLQTSLPGAHPYYSAAPSPGWATTTNPS